MVKGFLSILLVEDHLGFRKCTRDYLQFVIHSEIIEAGDGLRAMELMKDQVPDIVIVDFNLPGLNGIEVTKAVYRLNASAKVIMMTGHCEREIVRAAFDAGVLGFVTKQDSSLDLVDCIEAVLKGHRFVSRSISYELPERRVLENILHSVH